MGTNVDRKQGIRAHYAFYEDKVNRYQEMALQIENARKKIHATFANRGNSDRAYQVWLDACIEFNVTYHRLHTNDQLYPNEAQLKQGDVNAIQVAINYLSADLYYFSSGYNKELITSLLKRLVLAKKNIFSTKQLKQLELILLNKVISCYGREFRYYCRLAKALPIDTLYNSLTALVNFPEPHTSLRATWMLHYLAF
jgi:hypothetical protein